MRYSYIPLFLPGIADILSGLLIFYPISGIPADCFLKIMLHIQVICQ